VFEHLQDWLGGFPPTVIYALVGLIIGAESMGIPLPGEVTLISATLLSASGVGKPWWVAVAAATGAIIGDSIGYAIGLRGGRKLLEKVGRRFPKHFGPAHLARAEHLFARWGVWAVFFGRFVALLRILAGPLAGALRVPYARFLVANAAGGIVWAGGTVALVYVVGAKVESWLKGSSWIMLGLGLVVGIITTIVLKKRALRIDHEDVSAAQEGIERPIGNGAETASPTVSGT
jgi:membrane protein DedA with SNARE-associated domain